MPPPATWMRDTALEIALAVDLGVLLQRLPLDADLAHPMHRRVRFLDQRVRQLAVHAALRHAVEIGHEVVGAVRRDHHGGERRLVHLGHELSDFLGAGVHETEAGAGIARVAAVFGLRRLLQHHHALGACLTCGDRRLEGRAAAADHDDVALLDPCRHAVYSSALMPAIAMYSLTTRPARWTGCSAMSFCSSAPPTARPTGRPRRSASARYSWSVHQPHIGLPQDFETIRRYAGRSQQRQPDPARRRHEAEQRLGLVVGHDVGEHRHVGQGVERLHDAASPRPRRSCRAVNSRRCPHARTARRLHHVRSRSRPR